MRHEIRLVVDVEDGAPEDDGPFLATLVADHAAMRWGAEVPAGASSARAEHIRSWRVPPPPAASVDLPSGPLAHDGDEECD